MARTRGGDASARHPVSTSARPPHPSTARPPMVGLRHRVLALQRSAGNGAVAAALGPVVQRQYAGALPAQVADATEARAVVDRLEAWGRALVARLREAGLVKTAPRSIVEPLTALNDEVKAWKAGLAGAASQATVAAVGAALAGDALAARLEAIAKAWEASFGYGKLTGVSGGYEGELQLEEPQHIEAEGAGAEDRMLRAASGTLTGAVPANPAWTSQPIPVRADHDLVPEELRTLIRFIAGEDSAVGMSHQPAGGQNRNRAPAEDQFAAAVGPDQRPALGARGERHFEKAHFGTARSWHLDESGRLPHPDAPTLGAVRSGARGPRAQSYLAANEEDFARGLGVPAKLRSGSTQQAVGLVEFNTPKVGPKGRLVYDYVNHRFYFTPDHYQPWTSAVYEDKGAKLFPFFLLTDTEHLLLRVDGMRELARLRYWERQRRADLETLL